MQGGLFPLCRVSVDGSLCAEINYMCVCVCVYVCVRVCVYVTLRRCKAVMLFMAEYYLSVLSSDRQLYGASNGFATRRSILFAFGRHPC